MFQRKIKCIDINLRAGVKSDGVVYYRISKDLKEFIEICEEKFHVIGFECVPGEWNFGVILGEKK